MNISDIIGYANSLIGDSSTDRLTASERYQAATEAVAWLLEELGNEHMVDRVDIDFVPTVTWYKMDNLTPYLLGSGELKLKEDKNGVDFTKVDSREINSMNRNRYSYAIERYNGDAFLGIVVPDGQYNHKDLVSFVKGDGLTYSGTNASNIVAVEDYVQFDMTATGVTATGLNTTTQPLDISSFGIDGVFAVDLFIPDVTDVTSVTLRFGADLLTDYYIGTVTQDLAGNALVEGDNSLLFKFKDMTLVGTVDLTDVTKWQVIVNHDSAKPAVDGFRLADLRVAKSIPMSFKYLFYRVGRNAAGTDIIEFGADTDVPFFADRYPQYKFAVGHKTASVLYRFLQLWDEVRQESREADVALTRFRKNFPSERDAANSAFRPAGINLRRNRIIRRR